MFPIGKYIGKIRAGMDKTDAAMQVNKSYVSLLIKSGNEHIIFFSADKIKHFNELPVSLDL